MGEDKDHLFINYATEDGQLAEWLTLKLTSEGYHVWCDRVKLLGGESYPLEIQQAITNRTFKVIGLISQNSLTKANPTKERTLALNISRERKEDFFIPLLVEKISPSDLNWMISDLTYIPFHDNWAIGLSQLLKKLSSVNAPRTLPNGRSIASEAISSTNFLNPIKEKVHTNLLQIQKLPATIKKFKFGRIPTEERIAALEQMWAFYTKDKQSVYSFHSPPQNEADKLLINSDGLESTQAKKIGEIPTSNIIKFLIVRSLENACLKKGLVRRSNEIPHRRHLYFPLGLLEKEKFHFTGYNNKKTYVQVAGTRTKTGQPYKYHLSPRFAVQLEKDVSFVRLNIQNHITQDDGTEFSGRSAMSRRKSLSKGLWNHQWLQRYFAVASFLSDGKETITLGETVEEQVILGSKFYFAEAPVGIREDLLPHNLEPLELDQDEEQAGTEAHSEDGN